MGKAAPAFSSTNQPASTPSTPSTAGEPARSPSGQFTAKAPLEITVRQWEQDSKDSFASINTALDMTATAEGGVVEQPGKANEPGRGIDETKVIEKPVDKDIADQVAGATKPDAETETKPEVVAVKPEPTSKERRRKVLDAIAYEQQKQELHTTLANERAARAAAETRANELAAKPRRSVTEALDDATPEEREAALERLIIGAPAAPAAKPAEDPTVKELREKVAALEAAGRTAQTAQETAAVAQAVAIVNDAIKDADVPLTKALGIPGTELVIKTANQAWINAGRLGHPRDYIVGAAQAVEDYVWEQNKAVIAAGQKRAGAVADVAAKPAPVSAAPVSAAIGKRSGARADGKVENDLSFNRQERDLAIKKEMGW